jgi:hypothetical protein
VCAPIKKISRRVFQVCNWFANWRRKLKNAGKEPQRKTWGDLIKSYNSQVQGNVEHFSICSDDSIWEEPEDTSDNYDKPENIAQQPDHSYTTFIEHPNHNNNNQNQCFFISSTTEIETETNPFSQPTNKYKNHIMEKYLRDCQKPDKTEGSKVDEDVTKPSMISKWLESAVNFRPSENNYLHWNFSKNFSKKKKKTIAASTTTQVYQIHGREELDAAEALTKLANARSFKA